jgi:2-dehydro-3-deoxygalactonokinase
MEDFPPHAALIGLDWGTTSLRAYLFDAAGRVIAKRESNAGIMNLPRPPSEGGFDQALDAICGAWLDHQRDLPIIAAGMVGSAQGWAEAPYVMVPANAISLADGIVQLRTARGTTLNLVPGVIEYGGLPNVMRGEEVQIVGASREDEATGSHHRSTLIGLPGTHAKWAVVGDECIERFYTFMTGEVFAALCTHTILGRTMAPQDCLDVDAFLLGIDVAKRWREVGMLSTIFSTRTLGLTGQLMPEQQSDYLSGLLIGHELIGLEGVLISQGMALTDHTPVLIGNNALCERYRLALSQFGCAHTHILHQATERGLWHIATQAGLVTTAVGATSSSTPPQPIA